jgi:hypothetical protein
MARKGMQKLRFWKDSLAGAELDDAAAVAFGGAAFGQGSVLLHGFSLGGFALALFLARFCFAIEGLGNGGGTADFTEVKDFDVKFAALVSDAEHVAYTDIARGLGFDLVGADAAEIAGLGGESARLEEARSPKPPVDADGICVLPSRHEISRECVRKLCLKFSRCRGTQRRSK